MATVISHMTMSLDGFIAHPDDTIDGLFDWYGAGPIEVPTANPGIGFHLDEPGAALMREMVGNAGALVAGRRLFDITDGWGDRHPIGAPVVVVTHRSVPEAHRFPGTTFIGDVAAGIEAARSLAGERNVIVSSADIARQALELGLLEEVWVSLAPILLGSGIPYFAGLAGSHRLADPDVVVGTRATHLRYRVAESVST